MRVGGGTRAADEKGSDVCMPHDEDLKSISTTADHRDPDYEDMLSMIVRLAFIATPGRHPSQS
jgi:hypothetical protein